MTFVQPFFLFVVLPLAVAAFYAVRSLASPTAALAVIVVASLIFYIPYGSPPLPLLCVSLAVNLAIGAVLARPEPQPKWLRASLLAVGLAFNFGVLATFKYLDQVQSLVSPGAAPLLALGIPAGISFYTFHQAVFLRDAERRQPDVLTFVKTLSGPGGAVSLFVRYAAFVAFFPQLIIGPITYMSEFGPQVRRATFGRLKVVNLQVGATLIIVGLFKKLCVADVIGHRIDPIYDTLASGSPISQSQALLAISGYFFQLYFDFSGYSDIALGIARLFGIRLPINFDSPLRSTGIIDFYRRWHITLTRVIVIFIFTPLSLWGTRFALKRNFRGWRLRALSAWLPFVANFQIIALWHAAKYTFVVFGLVHGLWYVLETEARASKAFKAYRARTSEGLRTVAGMAITVAPLMLTFALFRSPGLSEFVRLVGAAAGHGAAGGAVGRSDWAPVAGAALVAYLLPNVYELLRFYRPGIRHFVNASKTPAPLQVAWRPSLAWGLFLSLLAGWAFLRLNYSAPFLYGGF